MPYRQQRDDPTSESGDSGIIGDLVQQFADPFACLRELVQNAIDAGSSEVRVRLDFRDDDTVRLSVRDDGEGMDNTILEEQLFVLFKSGKEGLKDKIGKFGVGFVSVFALKPSEVIITTSRGEGSSWTSRLDPSHEYEIFEQAGGSSSGTTVALIIAYEHTPEEFVKDAEASLRRWCRHANLPIRFSVSSTADKSLNATSRIDRPLDLPGAWCVVQDEVEGTKVLVGAREIAGGVFFNHGLMLAEAQDEDELRGLTFKVQDSRLQHTMSRDDVRRDQAYKAAVRRVQEVARRKLLPKMLDELGRLDAETFCARLGAAERILRCLDEPTSLIRFPLLGESWSSAIPSKAAHAKEASALTLAISQQRDLPVFDGSGPLGALLRTRIGPPAEEAYSLYSEVEHAPSDALMLDAMLDCLEQNLRRPTEARLVIVQGLDAHTPFIAGKAGLLEGPAQGDPFRLLRRSGVLINANDPVVIAARKAAQAEPWVAGSTLARQVLLHFEKWNPVREREWIVNALNGVE